MGRNGYELGELDEPVAGSSWLIEGDPDRERLLDMDRRLRPVRLRTFAVLAVALVVASPWVGWWTLGPLALAAALFRVAEMRIKRAAHPEYWMLAAWAGAEAIIALSLALTGDSATIMLSLLAIPVVTLSARFSTRGVWVGVGIAAALIVAVALGTSAREVVDNPPLLIGTRSPGRGWLDGVTALYGGTSDGAGRPWWAALAASIR
ncbi:MAG: hypothetical protein FVQ78_10800 [Solirubrobacterales bacterium]|nr:hypothetical protein [Solirubrobacterales bacterium]